MIRHKKDYAEPTNLIYEINREDDRFYETDDLDDVLSDPNVANSKVSILYIQLRKEAKKEGSKSDDDIICQIKFQREFETTFFRRDVDFKIISGDRTWSLTLADELEPQINRVFKAKGIPKWIFSLFVFPLFLCYLIIIKATKMEYATPIFLLVLSFGVIPILISDKLRKFSVIYLGPESGFLWGDEVIEYKRREQIRKNIFWVVIIGFIISFSVSGLWYLFGKMQ